MLPRGWSQDENRRKSGADRKYARSDDTIDTADRPNAEIDGFYCLRKGFDGSILYSNTCFTHSLSLGHDLSGPYTSIADGFFPFPKVFSTVQPVNDTQTTLASFISDASSDHPHLIGVLDDSSTLWNEGLSMVSPDDKATQNQLFVFILSFKHRRFIVRFDFRTINYYVSLVSFGKCVHLVYDVLSKLRISVILYYDHTLTLPMEIQRFWIRGFTWAKLFFFINRYLAFLGHIPVIMQVFWSPSNLSHKFTVSIQFFGRRNSYH